MPPRTFAAGRRPFLCGMFLHRGPSGVGLTALPGGRRFPRRHQRIFLRLWRTLDKRRKDTGFAFAGGRSPREGPRAPARAARQGRYACVGKCAAKSAPSRRSARPCRRRASAAAKWSSATVSTSLWSETGRPHPRHLGKRPHFHPPHARPVQRLRRARRPHPRILKGEESCIDI